MKIPQIVNREGILICVPLDPGKAGVFRRPVCLVRGGDRHPQKGDRHHQAHSTGKKIPARFEKQRSQNQSKKKDNIQNPQEERRSRCVTERSQTPQRVEKIKEEKADNAADFSKFSCTDKDIFHGFRSMFHGPVFIFLICSDGHNIPFQRKKSNSFLDFSGSACILKEKRKQKKRRSKYRV